MTPLDTANAYDQITYLWNNETFNRRNGIEQHKKAIGFVQRRTAALDVGCGCTGRFIDLLLSEGFTPEGVDVSEQMIRLARDRHPEINFYHQDICEWGPPGEYDFISAWDSLWHVPLDQQENVVRKLISSLGDNGVLIFSFGGTDSKGEKTDDFMGPEMYYASLGVNGYLSLLIQSGCLCRHLEYDQHPEQHSYIIVQKA